MKRVVETHEWRRGRPRLIGLPHKLTLERVAILDAQLASAASGRFTNTQRANARGHELSQDSNMTRKVSVKVDVKVDAAKCLWYLFLIVLIVVT